MTLTTERKMPEADDEQTQDVRIARLEALLSAVLQPTFAEISRGVNNIPGVHAEFNGIRKSARASTQDNEALRVLVQSIQNSVQTPGRVRSGMQQLRSEIDHESAGLRLLLDGYLFALSFGLEPDKLPLQRVLPARIYISKVLDHGFRYSPIRPIVEAFENLLAAFGLERDVSLPPEFGSWFGRFFVRTKEFLSKKEVEERLKLAEHALNRRYIGREQAEIDKVQAEAAATLLNALKDTGNSAVQIGSLLLLRYRDAVGDIQTVIRTLTPREMMFLEQNQDALKEPRSLLQLLAKSEEPLIP
jgi:hypothetical protein